MNSGFGPDPETVTYLRDPNSNREVYLIGTAHVSQQSADDVKELIDLVKPSCVMIELCPARADRIRKEGSEAADFFTIASKAMAGNKGDFFEGLLRTALASFYNIFRQMGSRIIIPLILHNFITQSQCLKFKSIWTRVAAS
jgi:pheromone shutdown protein TraB